MPDVEVRMPNGRPTIFIDGKPDALPGTYRVTDLVSGDLYADAASVTAFDLHAPETRVFLLPT